MHVSVLACNNSLPICPYFRCARSAASKTRCQWRCFTESMLNWRAYDTMACFQISKQSANSPGLKKNPAEKFSGNNVSQNRLGSACLLLLTLARLSSPKIRMQVIRKGSFFLFFFCSIKYILKNIYMQFKGLWWHGRLTKNTIKASEFTVLIMCL